MKYGNAVLRHELKYYINWNEYWLLRARLAPVMRLDENTVTAEGYHIRSLYFDDMYDTAMQEKMMGTSRRDKYRIRIYELSDQVIRFECKSKYDSYISKKSAPLSRTQVEQILAGDYTFLAESGDPLLQQIYARRNTTLLRPAVIVDYRREAYVYREGNVRITFDKDISAGAGDFNIFSKEVPTYPVVPSGQLVLEIKYDDYLPKIIHNAVKSLTGDISAVSKYVMCRERLADLKTASRRVVNAING